MRKLSLLVAALALVASVQAKDPAELSKETIAYCASTAKDKATPKLIMEKVNKAAELVAKDGVAAFPKFKGNGSEFLFAGTYIWIHDINGVMKMHPIKYKMEGKRLLNLKDRKGKMIFVEMNKVAKENGAGWVEYVWPKPGEKAVSPKTSYVKYVKKGDLELIIGCGVYDLTEAEVKKQLGK